MNEQEFLDKVNSLVNQMSDQRLANILFITNDIVP
jgi:hypothetical protein